MAAPATAGDTMASLCISGETKTRPPASIVAMIVGVHVVVNRPTLAAEEQDLRLDDALRADGAHHIVGASFAMGGIATAYDWPRIICE